MTRRRAMKAVLGGAAATALGVLGAQQSQAEGGECQAFCRSECSGEHGPCMRECLCVECRIGCGKLRS